jgi:hypothetical protein
MRLKQIPLTAWAILDLLLGPLLAWLYSSYRSGQRQPLPDNPNIVNIDLRSLGDIRGMAIILAVAGLVAMILSAIAIRKKQKWAKLVLVIALIPTLYAAFMLVS